MVLTSHEQHLLESFRNLTKGAREQTLSAAVRDPKTSGPLIEAYRAAMLRPGPSGRFSPTNETRTGVRLTLIGEWIDLAAYYAGGDGNAWSFNAATRTIVNCGELSAFRANFTQRFRGFLFSQE